MTEVTLAITCMIDGFSPEVGEAVVRSLRQAGHTVSVPLDQTCCGQPAWNSGFVKDAAKVAANTLDALDADGQGPIVVPAGSCATMMRKFWPEMFSQAGDQERAERAAELAKRTFEYSEFIHDQDDHIEAAESGETVVYHHSCHMLRELEIREQPLELLEDAGVKVAEWSGDDRCCGFGGLFSVKLPEVSEAMADEKLATMAETGATTIVGCDTSCLMHLKARAEHEGIEVEVRHLAEVLAPEGDAK